MAYTDMRLVSLGDTMHKLGLEETLKSHLTACAPSLKSLMKTTHKALTEFLVKNGEKLDQAHRDKSTSSKVTVIDLTLADEDIEIIAPRLRAPTKPPPNNTAVQQTSQAKKKRKRSQPVNKTGKSLALLTPSPQFPSLADHVPITQTKPPAPPCSTPSRSERRRRTPPRPTKMVTLVPRMELNQPGKQQKLHRRWGPPTPQGPPYHDNPP
jgi:hypothetical protein